jgi:hypothetical protein
VEPRRVDSVVEDIVVDTEAVDEVIPHTSLTLYFIKDIVEGA